MAMSTSAVPGKIFISYRREDTAFAAGWLFDRLSQHFTRGTIFKDVDSIELGDDFVERITAAVASCDIELVLIGTQWLTITDETGQRRLDRPEDFVRLEIEAALARDVLVIPILIDETKMPKADQLPTSMAKLANRHALELSPSRFDADSGRLLKVLEKTLIGEEPSAISTPPTRRVVPRQLPAVSRRFVGREDALQQLDELLDLSGIGGTLPDSNDFDDSAATIVTVIGSAGIGKTALALRWAHHVQDRFPDGQLYVNLRGFDPTDPPVPADTAVRGFLYAFEVPPEQIPATVEAQSALYRSLIADRQVLVLLDNARDVDQVRPLLPGVGKCFVLITSRNRLGSLLVHEGARSINLPLLGDDKAHELMVKYLGPTRVASEPDAVQALVSRCHGLPLALAIVAARTMTYPDVPLSVLVRDLTRESDLLGTFESEGHDTGVEAAFSWSYRSLSPAAAHAFRLCGLYPGPDMTVETLASLAAQPRLVGTNVLGELATTNFLEEYRPGRFRLHDLLQAYAAKRAEAEETILERRAALERAFDHYLHSAYAADKELYPYRHQIDPGEPVAGVLPRTFVDAAEAMAWFSDEIDSLLTLTEYAAANGWDRYAWQLPWTFATFLHRQGGWHDYAVSQEQGLAAAYRSKDPVAIARCERNIGRPYTLLGRTSEAAEHYTLSLRMCQVQGDAIGEALCEDALAWLWGRNHQYADAIKHAERALTIYTRIDNSSGRARALNYIGWNQGRLGNYQKVLGPCTEALKQFRSVCDQVGEADTLDSIGYAYAHLGHYDEAVTSYKDSIKLWQTLGDRYNEADLLSRLGEVHQSQGNVEAARTAWTEALKIFNELDHPDAKVVQAKLEDLDPSPTAEDEH